MKRNPVASWFYGSAAVLTLVHFATVQAFQPLYNQTILSNLLMTLGLSYELSHYANYLYTPFSVLAVVSLVAAVLFARFGSSRRQEGVLSTDHDKSQYPRSSRPRSIVVIGVLGVLSGLWGTLVGSVNVFGMLVSDNVARDAIEWAYQGLGLILSVLNVTGSVGIILGRKWARNLLFVVCGLSILHAGIFSGILSGSALGWMIWTLILVPVLCSYGARAFFVQRSYQGAGEAYAAKSVEPAGGTDG